MVSQVAREGRSIAGVRAKQDRWGALPLCIGLPNPLDFDQLQQGEAQPESPCTIPPLSSTANKSVPTSQAEKAERQCTGVSGTLRYPEWQAADGMDGVTDSSVKAWLTLSLGLLSFCIGGFTELNSLPLQDGRVGNLKRTDGQMSFISFL